jgi:protease I
MAQPLKVLIPAYRDFDPTEIAIPWKLLTELGKDTTIPAAYPVEVTFTTIDGKPAACDSLVLKGPIFGFFGASKEAKNAYEEMVKSDEFLNPLKWEDTDFDAYDGVWLGGGHAKGVREYLDSKVLQSKLAKFMPKTKADSEDPKVLAAICHGPVLLSRTIDETGKSVLAGRKTSCLPYHMERDAYNVSLLCGGNVRNSNPTAIQLTRFHLGDYYSEYLATCPSSMEITIGLLPCRDVPNIRTA